MGMETKIMSEIIYILTNESMPGYVKIGKTTNLRRRLSELYSTPVPLPFECHYACEVKNSTETEAWLFNIFNKWRISKEREFFMIDPEGAVEALKAKALKDITPQRFTNATKEEEKRIIEIRRNRARFDFSKYGIPVGSTITFSRDDSIKADVLENDEIKFKGKNTNISLAAKNLLRRKYFVAGPRYWKYKDETLDERRRRMDLENKD